LAENIANQIGAFTLGSKIVEKTSMEKITEEAKERESEPLVIIDDLENKSTADVSVKPTLRVSEEVNKKSEGDSTPLSKNQKKKKKKAGAVVVVVENGPASNLRSRMKAF
jgi:hypothetical protein